jgi:hypothetical protein
MLRRQNKPGLPNPAMAPIVHVGRHRQRLGDPEYFENKMRFLVATMFICVACPATAQSINSTNAPFASLEAANMTPPPALFTIRSRDLTVIRDFRNNLRKFLADIGFKKEEPRDKYWMNDVEWFVGRYKNSEMFRISVSERLQIYTWVEGTIVWNDAERSSAESREAIARELSARIYALHEQ